jgi:Cytochrome bd terminal oxidase subunit I/Cytochrome bd terminal oxidase subunit II
VGDGVTAILAISGGVFPSADQDYLLVARQMQALSLAVHIPLVCFGIAFPAMVLLCEWRYLRTGDSVFRTLARRWLKVMLALFAVGVVTGTILSFELGLLWPAFTANFANVFGLGFTLEGFSCFIEAIFIGIYVYGWDRLAPRLHFLSGIPVAIAGVTGSLFVISINGWMNHPGGFTLQEGRALNEHPWSALFGNSFFWHEFVHMYFAGYIVSGFLVGAAYAWGFLRGRWGRYERTAMTIALSAAALAGADFGAGLWTLLAGPAQAGRAVARDHARHAMGPVWQANHVWLIFVLTVCWTAYPVAFGSITSTLAVPLFIAAVGIILRGASYALRGQLDQARGQRAIENLFALSSILNRLRWARSWVGSPPAVSRSATPPAICLLAGSIPPQ